jgi:type IV pilus assembly protein PilE
MQSHCRRRSSGFAARGFTLIELLVVIGIIGILAAIAVPQYNEFIVKGKLTEAISELTNGQLRIEQYYQDNRSYANAGGTCAIIPAATSNFTYTCALTNANQGFTMTATSTALGFTFTVTESGAKATTAVPAGWATSATCWVKGKSGNC